MKSVYKQRTGNTFEDTDYESFGLIEEKGNLTNAGALLADESPVRNSRLFCTRWNGLSKASGIVDALDDKEYTGSLVTLLQDGTDFVRNNSKKAWRKVGDGRIEMPDYLDRAVLEGVVNALIHRNYMGIGSEVHIDMFDDRIEIYSPGGMVSGISLEGKDLLKIPSKRRNPILADIFSRLKYMERRGSGFKKILADYEGQVEFDETKMPVFEADNDDFTLTLYNLNYGSSYAAQTNENVIENVIEISEEKIKKLMPEYSKKKLAKACEILKMISQNSNISIDELRIALDVTDRTIARYRLKATKIEENKGASLVFCWDTHLTKIKGRNVLFIVNASNRYTIAMTDIEPRNWNYYTMYIRSVIHGVMQEMGYSEEQIGQYFKMSGDTTVTKTHGRKSVGGINRMVMDAQYFGKKLEKEAKYQWELSEYLNRDICQPEGFDAYGYPSELFKLDMERLEIAAKRKPAKVIDFVQNIENNRGTND